MLAASKSRKERLAALRAKKAAAAASGSTRGTANGSASSTSSTSTTSSTGGSAGDVSASRKRQRPSPSSASSAASASQDGARSVKFRNYAPAAETSDAATPALIQPPSEIVGERVAGAVAEAMAPRDPGAPIVIVQKKIDWDLKRDVAPMLDMLEMRTRIAVRELLRQQLAGVAQ
jgi:hypothetical protein